MSNLNQLLTKLDSMAKIGENTNIQAYIDQLIKDKNFPDLTDEVREQVKRDLVVRLDDFIMARIISALSDEEVVRFESMLKEQKPEPEIQQYIVDHVTDLTNLLTETLMEFREIYLGLDTEPPAKETKSIETKSPAPYIPAPTVPEAPPPPTPAPLPPKGHSTGAVDRL